jgi:hypothetical protein
MARFFGNISFVNILFVGLIAAMVLMPELGFCDVPVIGKMVSKTKELTEHIKKFLIVAFGLYIICAGVMFLKNPDMLANHMFKNNGYWDGYSNII